MKLNVFVLLAVILAGIFGLGLLLIPNQVISLYGSKLDTVGEFMCRYFGSALLGLGVTWYTARSAKTIEAMTKGGLLGGLVFAVTGLVVAIWDGIAGAHTSFIWLNTVIYGVMTIGFGYFYFKKEGFRVTNPVT